MKDPSFEQRKHRRYAATDVAVAATKTKMGHIINISKGGMTIDYISDELFSDENKVTILCGRKNLYIKDLPIKIVRKSNRPFAPMGTFRIQTIGVKFNFSNTAQRDQVKQYLSRLSEN